ncbi:hypothetical protein KIN20_022227 [Parelaphostrongylus tenuis]|uniref:Uncharacterized protein n=1 Tax=Parelaphostrongylus tenuis TaxID=148309 RepID=A0AAD5MPX1_PARTN|nr:hypothetical protein KIN20_022227 [Parelaphostrongylus tenuis]
MREVRRQNTLQRQPSLAEQEQFRQQGNGTLPQHQSTFPRVETNRTIVRQRPKTTLETHEIGKSKLGDKRSSQSLRTREDKRHKENRAEFCAEMDNRFEDRRVDRKSLFGESEVSERSAVEHPRVTREQDLPHENFADISDGNSHSGFRTENTERGVSKPFDNKSAHLVPSSAGNSHRGKKGKLHRQIQSMSSSEDDLPSTSAGFGEEVIQRVPNECTSEKGSPGAAIIRHSTDESRSSSGVCTAPVIPGDMLAAKIRTYLSVKQGF